MPGFDVQSVELPAPVGAAFKYIADPKTLPEWTHAFRSVSDGRAVMATPKGAVEIGLQVLASREQGTVDWLMTFPDGSRAQAYSRLVGLDDKRSVYSFVMMAPPVPLERIEGALAEQSKILREELKELSRMLARRHSNTEPRERE